MGFEKGQIKDVKKGLKILALKCLVVKIPLYIPLNTVAVQETLLRDQSVAWLGQVGRLLVLYCTVQL